MHLVNVLVKPASPEKRSYSYSVNAQFHKPFHMNREKETRINVASGEDVCLNVEEEAYVFS